MTFDQSQLAGLAGISTGGGTNMVIVKNVTNFSGGAVSFTNWTGGVDTLVLEGTAGTDNIIGSAFADRIIGTAGADTLDGGQGGDTYIFSASAPGAGIYLNDSGITGVDTVRIEQSADFRYGTLGGIEAFEFTGASQTLALFASQTPSTPTPVTVTGAVGTQTIVVSSATSFDGLAWSFQSWSSAEGDHIELLGTAGNDAILGTASDDYITGAAGADTLRGRGGNDLFDFQAGSSGLGIGNIDQILDFTSGQDRLRFTDLTGSIEIFVGTDPFDPFIPDPEIRYQLIGSDTYILADIDGDDVEDMAWVLVGFSGTLTWGDDIMTWV